MEYAIPLRETAKHTIRKSRESKRNNDPEMVQGIFEDVAMQNLDDTGNYIADGAGIDVKFNVNELPKWDGGITKEKGYEPTLRQFIQRIEDIGRMKGWGEQGGLLVLPNMLEGGIRFALMMERTDTWTDGEQRMMTILKFGNMWLIGWRLRTRLLQRKRSHQNDCTQLR